MSKSLLRVVVIASVLAAGLPAAVFAASVDMSIYSISASPDPITLGTGNISYAVQVYNSSASAATNVVLTNTLPASSTFVSATASSGGSCTQSGGTATCTWTSIPAGNVYSATIVVTPTAGGTLILNASVAATEADPNTVNNSAGKGVTVNSQIDLGISSMTVSPDPMTLGTGDVQFLVQFTNNSSSQATNAVLTSTIPVSSTFVSATTPVGSGSCSQSAGTVTCNWASIGPGSTYYAYITVTPTAGGALTLSSSVSATQSDPNTTNNSGSKAVTVNSQIDLGISSMTVSPDPMTLGTGNVQFLVQYSNGSTSQATNVVLTSSIPAGSTFVSATTPVGSGSCSQSAGTVTCNWASIGPGSTYYAYITVTPTAAGSLSLTSTVSAAQSDPNTSNNSGSKAVTVNSQIDLGISSMTVSPDPMTLGTGNVQFLVQFTNNSTSQATNAVLTSTIPVNSTFVSATTPVGSGSCSQSAGTVTCNWASIGPGSTYYAYITITPAAGGVLTLSSTVSAAQSDPNTSNNSGNKAVTVNSQIDLGILSMTVSPDPMTLGTGDVQFVVYYTNASTSQATNVVLTSTLPVNSTFVSATTPVGSGTCSQSAGTVTCNWATIGPGSTYYAYITVTPAAAGLLSLTSTVSAAQSDPNTSNNTGTKASTVNSDIDLSISTITGTPDPITLGNGNVLYTVYLYNSSGSQGTNVVLTSTLPVNSTFVSATTPVGSGSCSQSAGTVTCSWASLGAGSTYYAYITVTPTANGVMVLSASVAGAQTDSNSANNSASKGVTVGTGGTGVDLQVYSVTATPDPITINTGNVTYTVSVYNASGTAGTNTVLTNTLPANASYVSSSATNSGTCTQSGSTVTCNWTSTPATSFNTATIVVTPIAGGSMALSANVSGTETDPNTANNSGYKSVTVNAKIDLQIYSMSGTPDPITLNSGNVTYSVSVYNTSSSQGTNTVLTNTLPANSAFVSASATNSGTCTQSGSTVTCNWASIPQSGFYTATIVVTPTSGGSLTLSSSVSGTEADSNTANNTASKSTTVNSQIDLRVYSMSASPDPITLGTGNVTYNVAIYNNSTSQGTNTVLTNTLPANSTYVSSSATNSGTCTPSGSTVTCNWTSIPASGFYTVTIVVTPTAGGAMTLSSSVAGTETDPNTADNSGSKSVTVNSQIDLQIYSMSGTPDPITLNTGNVTYTVNVYNASSSQGTNTVLTNTLPANSTFVSASATNSGTCTQSGSTVTCNWTSIPSSGFDTANIVVTPTSGGALTLSSNVSGTEPDSNTANNTASKSVTVNAQIDLRLYSMSASPDPITLNTGNVTYNVSIYNSSTSQGTNTVLTNTLPANSTYVSSSATNSGTCTRSGSTVTCNWTSIPASGFYTATIVVTPTSGGSLTLSSSVSGTETDPNTADNSSSKSVTVNSQIDLQIYSMSGTPDPITLNTGNVTYSVSIYNISSSQGTNTVLTNTLPSNSTFVSASATNSGTCTQSGGTVTCNWVSIPASGFYTVTIVVTPTSGGPLTLSSSVSGTEADSNTANNSGNKAVTVNDQIDLKLYSITATPDPITIGAGNVTFTVNVYNQSTSQSTSVVLTNTLPSNSTYVSSSASNSGTCSRSGSTVTCNWASIPAFSIYSATIVVTPAIPGSLTLSASVSGAQTDPNTADNAGSHASTVTATSCTAIPSGAVAWYRAENNGVDSTGPNFATANGGATYTTGEVNQAFSLNGTTAYVSAPDNTTLRLAAFTIEGWFNLTGGTGVRTIVSKTAGTSFSDSFVVYIAANGAIAAGYGDTSSIDAFSTSTFPATNVWHHFAYTYDGTTQQLYLDGASAGSAAATPAIGYDTHSLLIGADVDNQSAASFFPGRIDEVTMYSRVLTPAEIQTVYGAGTFGKCYVAAPAPTVTGFTPGSGNTGASVVITGTDFTAVSAVKFNGTSATFTGNSSTQITATVPASATTGAISVVAGGGTGSSAGTFTVLTATHWINSSGGNWNTASNWSSGSVPTAANDVVIDAAGTYTVTLDVTPAFNSLTVGGATGTQTLDLGVAHDVTFASPATVTASGALTFASGRLLGAGPLTVNGVMNWTADAEVDTTVTVASGATLNISGTGTRYINGGTLNNSGAVNWSGGNNISIYGSGVINNLATGLFVATNDQLIYQSCCAAGQAFNNAGTFRKTAGTSVTTIDGNGFNNSGTLDVQSGTVTLGSGGTSTGIFNAASSATVLISSVYTLGSGATLTGNGNYQLAAGQLAVSAAGVTVNHMTLTGGNLNINGGGSVSTTASGVIDWNADATLSGAGTLNVAAGGTLNFSGSGTRYIDGGTLNNSGTINWSGGNNLSVYDNGVINNLAGGLFLATNDQIIYFHCCLPGQAFNNAGTFRKTTATNTTTITSNGFNNSGTVDIQSGTLNLTSGGTSSAIFNAGAAGRLLFNGAAYTLSGAATLTGSGNFEINGGQVNVTGSAIAVNHLTMDGGTLNVTGAISTTPAGVVDWSADSTLTGAGSMTIASGATMNITGSGTRYIDGGTLNNDGTIHWSGGNNLSVYNSGVINNHASGVFNVKNDQIIYFHCCTPGQAFNNAGTLRKTIATGTTTITSNGLTNSGTVDVQSGTLNLTSGGTSTAIFNAGSSGRFLFTGAAYTLAGAATLTGAGNFEVGGGQVNVTGSAIAVGHLTLSGGTLNVTGAMSTTPSGVVDWPSDSVLTGAGSLTIASGATMNINGSGTRYIDGGTLNNAGTVHWSGGNNLSIYNSGVINNQSGGLFDITNDQLVYFHCCLPGQPFNNAGTFRKSIATNTTTFSGIGFTNSGTLQPRSGAISFNGGFTNSGSPVYDFGIGSATTYGRLTFANPVALSGALIAAPVNSFVPQGGQQFTILSFPSGTATFSPKTLTFGSSPVRSFADSYSATAVTLTASGPAITTALSPNQGSDAGGTPVTITGSGFVSGGSLAVTFGGNAATAVTFGNSTTVTCTTPAHAAGVVDVVLTNGDGQPTTATNGFTYLAPTDIAINGSAPASATNGGTFTYTTVVTNNGPAAASGVTATITLPPNVTLASATSTQGTCSGATTVTCSIGAMPASGSATQTINLTATGFGTAVLNASASATQSDSNNSNNTTTSNVAIGGTSTLFVTTNADSGTGSLRQAILDANNASVCTACTIGFNLPGGQRLITPPTSLPAITAANVTIDATTQPGYSGAPLVTLDGSSNPNPSAGLQLSGGHDAVKGLSIVTFQGSAIVIDTAGNDVIAANYLGLQTDGLTPGQNAGEGILVTTANNTIGGPNAASRNVISANFGSGVVLKGATATGNAVRGNYIGLNAAGTSNLANITDGIQILLGASNNIIGGTTAADRNVISGNNNSGIYITSSATVCSGNLISANFIGTNAAGTTSIGNTVGIYLGTFVSANTIGGTAAGTGNTIVSNTTGITFAGPGDGNAILGNSITGNSGMTIDLGNNGPTANDAGDADTGPNEFQNKPTFVDASMAGSTLTAHVNVDSASVANTAGVRVELFKSDASGVHALSLLASQCFAGNALTGVAMTLNSAPVVIGDKLVATATSYADAACSTIADGTSELSSAATITTCTPPSATIIPSGPTTFCTGGSVTLTASAGASYQWRNFATPIIGANAQQYVATTAGSYTVTITNAAGCSATSSPTSISVNSAVNVTIAAGGPTTFCSGGNVTLTANPSGGSGTFASYQWLLNGSPIGGANATTFNATATGNYAVTVTDTNGCTGTSAPQSVSVTTPPSAAINAPASVCANSSAGANIVSPVGGATYTWSVTNGSVTFGQGTSSIIFAAGTTSPVSISVVASLGGCTASGSASVAVGAFTPAITGSHSFCPGGNTTLTASAANSYQWSLNGSPIGGATAQTYVATAAGNYTVTESNASGCNGTSAPFAVSQAPLTPPTITPGGPTTFCNGGSVTLTSSAAATYQWLINGSPIGGSTSQSINATASGSYSVAITSGSCSATSSPIAVTVNPTPAVSITGPTAVCAGGSATLDAGAGFATYAWSTGATTQSITVSPASTTAYSVTVTNNGCSASASKTITISSGATTATITAPSSVPTNSAGNTASVPPAQAGSAYNWTISGGTITSGNGTPSIVWTAGNSGTATIGITITSAACTASGSVNIAINDSADLALTMAATPNPVTAGGTLTFTLNAINNGPSDAQNVTVINSLFGVTTATASGNGWSCNASGLSVVCTRPSLAAGAGAPITITATVDGNSTGNSAGDAAAIGTATSDPNTLNNSASATVAVSTPVSCNNVFPTLLSPAAGAKNLPSSVNFTWAATPNATSYDLWIASSGAAAAIATTTQSTSATVNLPSGPSTWYIAAHFPNDCPTLASFPPRDLSVAASSNCTNAAPQLIAPSANATVNSPVTVSWTAVPQAIGYRLWLAIDGGPIQDAATTNGATSVTIPLTGSNVTWHVDAIFPGCPNTSSPSSNFALAPAAGCASHAAPSLLAPAPNASLPSSITDLQWTAAAGANGYRVWASINGAEFSPIATTQVTTLHFTFTTGSVAWYVEALFDGCPSTASAQQTFTIPPAQNCNNAAATPLAPANNATLTTGFVEFDWTAAANAIGYELWLSIDGGAPALAGTTTTTSLSRTVGTGTIEWYIRTLFDRCDAVDSAHLHFTVAPPANCSVARPILTAPFDGAPVFTPFDLHWSSVPGATQYKVRLGSSGDPQVIGTTSALHLDNVTTPTGPVTWSVEALFDNCPSVRSTVSAFTAVPPPPVCATPAVPQPRAESTVSSNVEFLIRWTPVGPNGTTQYELQESADLAFPTPSTITIAGSEFPFQIANSADAPSTIYFRVRAIGMCNGARSLFSPPLAVQVLPSNVTDPSNANGSTPADNPQTTHYQIHLDGGTVPPFKGAIAAAAGDTFLATTNQPWLTVSPSFGTVAPGGTTLNVTANPTGLPVGTSTAAVNVTFGSSTGSSRTTPLDNKPPATTTVSVNLVQPVSPTAKNAPPPDALIIPAVAHADGINSKFQSDVRVTNSSAQPMKYQITFTPTGEAGITQGKQTTVDIDPGRTIALDDVLESWFGSNGATGTLEVRPLTATTNSTSAALPAGLANLLTFASSRTFNTTSNGTFGQYIPAIPFAAFVGRASDPTKSTILSLQQIAQSAAYRTNLGIVEGSGDPASVLVSVFGDDGHKLTEFTQDLKGGQHIQLNSILAQKNVQVNDGRIEIKVVSPAGKVTAYASVLDNLTNDPLLVTPVAVNATAASRYVLPGVADLNNGFSNWQTDVRLFNPSANIVKATLTFYSQSGAAPQSKDVLLAPNQVQTFDAALHQFFGITNDGGALHISTTAATPLVATARTYNQTSNGTYGQFIPAVTANDAAALGTRPLQLLQIEESDRYRTNIGFAEVTGKSATVEVTAIPSDSKVAASTQINLAPNQFIQYPQLLKSMGLTNMYNARVTVKVISGQGRVTAYASVIDSKTNDPTFVPAQ
jgi:uncharacterized repeat protein (TIGR01451 family)